MSDEYDSDCPCSTPCMEYRISGYFACIDCMEDEAADEERFGEGGEE